jgi:hypothetical protein
MNGFKKFNFDPIVKFLNIQYSYENLYSKFPKSKFIKNNKFPDLFLLKNVKTFPDEINNNGYRCDNFLLKHDGLHILFSGCSYTSGSGLELEEVWSKKLYNKISKEEKCSGYFNLAMPGSSIINEIIDIFKYCNKYGNPDIIFLNMPDMLRFYGFNKKTNLLVDGFYNDDAKPFLYLLCFQYYYMLDKYCSSNNIKLFSFTWFNVENYQDTSFIENKIIDFKTFYPTSINDINFFVEKYIKENPKKEYLKLARDNSHHGIAYHEYWANFIYDNYKNYNMV